MKPAIFNTAMVRAIIDGRKTNTRRPFSKYIEKVIKYAQLLGEIGSNGVDRPFSNGDIKYLLEFSPYKVGDIIYVRETWAEAFEIEYIDFGVCEREIKHISDCISNFESIYKIEVGMSSRYSPSNAEERMRYIVYKAEGLEYTNKKYKLLWKPSIHMPKEYARLFLRVKDVCIERLNDISADDACKEGLDWKDYWCDNGQSINDPREWFKTLWESIYGNGSFDNRYVWVVEFERISKEEATSETAT